MIVGAMLRLGKLEVAPIDEVSDGASVASAIVGSVVGELFGMREGS